MFEYKIFQLAASLYLSALFSRYYMKIIDIPTVIRENPKGKTYSQDLFIYHGGWNNEDGKINYRLDALCVCLVEKGTYSMLLNSVEYTVGAGEILVCHPNDIFKNINFSEDFYGTFIYANLNLISSYLTSTDIRQALSILRRNPVFRLDDAEHNLFFSIASVLRIYEQSTTMANTAEPIVLTATGLLISVFKKILKERIPQDNTIISTRPATIYQDFINLLVSKSLKPHTLEYYASELSVTPKYLSHVSKVQSGRTDLEWIHEYIMNDAQRYLVSTDFSIKEIAGILGYTNVSFFCRTIRKYFGKTPLEIRNSPLHPSD